MKERTGLRGGSSLYSEVNRALERTEYEGSELLYLDECQGTFLGDDIIVDGLISQKEYAEIYSNFCLTYSNQDWCPGSIFAQLPEELQSLFFKAVCMNMSDRERCVTNLNTLPMPVGYIVSSEVMDDVKLHVQGMCVGMLDQVFCKYSCFQFSETPYTIECSVLFAAPDPIAPSSVLPSDSSHVAINEYEAFEGPENIWVDEGKDQAGQHVGTPDAFPDNESEQVVDLTAVNQDSFQTNNSGDNKLVAAPEPSFSHAPIIGIAAIASACLLLVAFVIYRRRKASLYDKTLKEINSVDGRATGKDVQVTSREPRELVVANNYSAWNLSMDTGSMSLRMPSENSSSSSRRGFGNDFAFLSKNVASDQIEEAVDFGNWDSVYKLASQLAEQEDLSTLSSADRKPTYLNVQRLERRATLGEEDRERARTLDELIASGDWTGVAVTSALYAGESGNRKRSKLPGSGFLGIVAGRTSSGTASTAMPMQPSPILGAHGIDTASETSQDESITGEDLSEHPLLQLKRDLDQAVDAGDWNKVLLISSKVEDHGEYQSGLDVKTLSSIGSSSPQECGWPSDDATHQAFLDEIGQAITRSDWALVSFYANKMLDSCHKGPKTNMSTSQALVPLLQPPYTTEVDNTSSSSLDKKTTLQKLVSAQKWKCVSVMSGLYEMEAKGLFISISNS